MKCDDTTLSLYLAHRAALVDYATPITGDRDRAEDVVQEAYLRFRPRTDDPKRDCPENAPVEQQARSAHIEGREQNVQIQQPVAFLYRIVRNLALDWGRRRRVEQRHQDDPSPLWWMTPTSPRTPEQEAAHRGDLQRLAQTLAQLPDQVRWAVEMHRFGGYTLQEISQKLDVSVPTAHRLVRQGLVRLAQQMDPERPFDREHDEQGEKGEGDV